MRMFWWQGGLHVEPESGEDTDALMRLWNAEKVAPRPPIQRSGCSTNSILVEEFQDGSVGQ